MYIFSAKDNISLELKSGRDEYSDILTFDADIWGNYLEYRKAEYFEKKNVLLRIIAPSNRNCSSLISRRFKGKVTYMDKLEEKLKKV